MSRGSQEVAGRRYDVVLLGVDERRDVDELMRDLARHLGLTRDEIASLVEEAPCPLARDIGEADARALVDALRRVGAYVKPRIHERRVSGAIARAEAPAATPRSDIEELTPARIERSLERAVTLEPPRPRDDGPGAELPVPELPLPELPVPELPLPELPLPELDLSAPDLRGASRPPPPRSSLPPASASLAPLSTPSASVAAPGGIGMFLVELPRAFSTPLAGASFAVLGAHLLLQYASLVALGVMVFGLALTLQVRIFGFTLVLGSGLVAIVLSAVSQGVIFRYARSCYEGARSGDWRPDVGFESRSWQDEYAWPGAFLIVSQLATGVPLAAIAAFTTLGAVLHTPPADPQQAAEAIVGGLRIVPILGLVPVLGVTLAAVGGHASAYWNPGPALRALQRMPVGMLIVFALGSLTFLLPYILLRYAVMYDHFWLAAMAPIAVGYTQAVQAAAFGILDRNAPD